MSESITAGWSSLHGSELSRETRLDLSRTPTPRVTVVMLTRDRWRLIGRAIRSVVEQHFQEWELIVVQDGPHHQVGAVVKEWQGRDGRIRHYEKKKIGNLAKAYNFGLAKARGEYIAILDDDDYWATPDKLEKQVRF